MYFWAGVRTQVSGRPDTAQSRAVPCSSRDAQPTELLSESSPTYAAALARRCTPQWTMLEIYMSDTTGTNAASTKRATC